MKKLLLGILYVLAVFCFMPSYASAQNLYINEMGVYYAPGDSEQNAFCNYTEYSSSTMANVSMLVTDGTGVINPWQYSARIEFDKAVSTTTDGYNPPFNNVSGKSNEKKFAYPNSCLLLCAEVYCNSSTAPISFGIDEMTFEVFKFMAGTNPLDTSSAPPLKTISMYNLITEGSPSKCNFSESNTGVPQKVGHYCAAWDGSYNLNGDFGKTNGNYGFRAKVKTQQTSAQGTQIDIEQTAAYPGQNQIPIQVDATDIHNFVSSVTAVGKVTIVPAQPYNFKYQLSKDATATIEIFDADSKHACADANNRVSFSESKCLVRSVIKDEPKVGEGSTDKPIANGDFWDGRHTSGAMMPAGAYMARISASANDEFGRDVAVPATAQITLDPLQITDIAVRPLGASPTDYATISYMLTEAATIVLQIYEPGTTFADINLSGYLSSGTCLTGDVCTETAIMTDKIGATASGKLVREYREVKEARSRVSTIWDGRNKAGAVMCDGNYVYALYAIMPSAGTFGNTSPARTWNAVTTKRIYTGTLPIIRGPVVASFSPSSSVIGSSPTAAGIAPFYFTYTPVRDATVSLKVFSDDNHTTPVRTIIDSETRAGGFRNKDVWDGLSDTGKFVDPGTYLIQLETEDPFNCDANRISTRTARIPVNLLRVVDVETTPLMSSSSAMATISYNMSETMNIDFKIYDQGAIINPAGWPNNIVTNDVQVIYSLSGVRPRRMKITESWDGKNVNGNMVKDGVYPYVLKAYSTQEDGTTKKYATDITYGYITVSRGQLIFNKFRVYPTIPTMYNSSEAVHLPPYGIEYSLSRQSTVTIRVVDAMDTTKVFAEIIRGENRDPDTHLMDYWDGKCTNNVPGYCSKFDFVKDGTYKIMAIAEDADQQEELRVPATAYQVIDVAPIKIYDVSIKEVGPDSPGIISYQVSEPMKVVTKIYEPGTTDIGYQEPATGLVKRLIGVKSARVQIEDFWDGTDETMFPVDDGTYVFSIFGTTVTAAIDGIKGSLPNYYIRKDFDSESYGSPAVYTIPVSRSGYMDVCNSFESTSYFAPNPYKGYNGWFRIPVKATGNVSLKIYNLAGDLVYSKNYGKIGAGSSIDGKGKCNTTHTHPACWPKINNSGKEVARGVYFAVFRFEAADGSKAICQTVKKILIP